MADSFSAPSLVEVSRGCITVTSALGWCPLLFGDRGGSGGQPLLPDLQACPTRWSELQEHPGVLVKTGNYSTEAALRQKSVFPKSPSSPRAAWAPGAALWSILQAPAGGGWCGGALGGVLGWWLACRGAGPGQAASCPWTWPQRRVACGSCWVWRQHEGLHGPKRPVPTVTQHTGEAGGRLKSP